MLHQIRSSTMHGAHKSTMTIVYSIRAQILNTNVFTGDRSIRTQEARSGMLHHDLASTTVCIHMYAVAVICACVCACACAQYTQPVTEYQSIHWSYQYTYT
jgi:hypothetical protein